MNPQQESDKEQRLSFYQQIYSLVNEHNEMQFHTHGKISPLNYNTMMTNLRNGRPIIILEREPVARELVKLLLETEEPITIGKSNAADSNYRTVSIPEYSYREISLTLDKLFNEGLLDFIFCHYNTNRWCFNSEVLRKPQKRMSGNLIKSFNPNAPLRQKLKEFYSRFS